MKTIILEKADDIHYVLKRYRKSAHFKFRGQSDWDWKLVPKAGRPEFSKVKDKRYLEIGRGGLLVFCLLRNCPHGDI